MKITLIIISIYALNYIFAYFYAHRYKNEWFRWVLYSVFHRKLLKRLKRDLDAWGSMGIVKMSIWLEQEYWYKKHWFGRMYVKAVVRKLKTLSEQ